jgi:hypothetical protein
LHHSGAATADFFCGKQRQIAGVALLLQIKQRTLLLPMFGVNNVPVRRQHE